jgi:fibronectin-binding autotransporter adhesin
VGNQLIVSNAGEFRVNTGLDVSSAGVAGGTVLVSGGILSATNSVTNSYIRVALQNAQGTFTFNGGTINVDYLLLTNGTASLFTFNSGVLNVKSSLVTNGVTFVVGDGSDPATLNLQGLSHSYGNGLSISANGTLTGAGTINSTVTLANGAVLAPGSGVTVGTLTLNNDLVLGNSSVLDYALGSASDEVIVNGNLTLGGTLNVSDSGGFGTGIYPLFTYTGTLVNNGMTIGTTPSPAFQYSVDTTSEVGVVNLDVTSAPLGPFATWQLQYFGSTSCALCGGNASYTGDGMSNTNKFLAGFNPTNSAASLHVISITKTNNNADIKVTYLGANGDSTSPLDILSRTNVLEFTTGTANGSYTNNFASTGQTNILSGGTGLGVVTNMLDSGGATNKPSRFYRVRVLLP